MTYKGVKRSKTTSTSQTVPHHVFYVMVELNDDVETDNGRKCVEDQARPCGVQDSSSPRGVAALGRTTTSGRHLGPADHTLPESDTRSYRELKGYKDEPERPSAPTSRSGSRTCGLTAFSRSRFRYMPINARLGGLTASGEEGALRGRWASQGLTTGGRLGGANGETETRAIFRAVAWPGAIEVAVADRLERPRRHTSCV